MPTERRHFSTLHKPLPNSDRPFIVRSYTAPGYHSEIADALAAAHAQGLEGIHVDMPPNAYRDGGSPPAPRFRRTHK